MKSKTDKWFKAKDYGWGWQPASWQGWLILFAFIALVVADFNRIDSVSHPVSDTLINFLPDTIALTLILIYICYKTGERPTWRWRGKPLKPLSSTSK